MESWFGDRLADLCLCVRANGLMESWFGDRLADLFVFMWEVMAGWKVDLKTVCRSVWFHCLYVKADGWMESWFEDRLSDSIVFYMRANSLLESWFEDRLDDLLFFVWELMAGWKVDLETGWLISLFLCEKWWLDEKLIWRQAGWSLCLNVRADGLMESWFEDRLADLFVLMWELMAWWKVDLKTGCLISLSLWESWWLDGKLIWRQAVWSLCLYVRANGLMESWFGDRLDDLFVFMRELMAGWKVDLKTD